MSGYTAEQFEQIPEFLRDDYEKNGEVYRHKTTGKVDHLKRSLDALDGKYKETNEKLSSIEAGKAAEIEAARAAALEGARNKGDVAAIEKRYQEQMADMEKRTGETLKQRDERIESLIGERKKERIDLIVSELSNDATDDGKIAFKRLIRARIDYNPENGQTIFLDEDGGATSLDLKGFQAELKKEAMLKPLLKATTVTTGGGQANGGSNFGGSASVNSKLSPVERITAARNKQTN